MSILIVSINIGSIFFVSLIRRDYTKLKALSILCIITFILCSFAYFFNRSFYYIPEIGTNYYNYKLLHSRIVDDNIASHVDDAVFKQALKEVAWSENDYRIFRTWLYADSHVYSYKKLKKFVSFINHHEVFHFEIKKKLRWIYHSVINNSYTRLCLILVGLSLLLFARSLAGLVLVFMTMLLTIISLVGISIFLKYPPPRLLDPLLLNVVIIVLISSDNIRSFKYSVPLGYIKSRLANINSFIFIKPFVEVNRLSFIKVNFFSKVLLLTLVLVFIFNYQQLHIESRKKLISYQEYIALIDYLNLIGVKRLVTWSDSFPYQLQKVFVDRQLYGDIEWIHTSSHYWGPVEVKKRERLNIKDLYLDMLKKGVFVVMREDYIKLLKNYYQQHYSMNVTVIKISYPGAWPIRYSNTSASSVYMIRKSS